MISSCQIITMATSPVTCIRLTHSKSIKDRCYLLLVADTGDRDIGNDWALSWSGSLSTADSFDQMRWITFLLVVKFAWILLLLDVGEGFIACKLLVCILGLRVHQNLG